FSPLPHFPTPSFKSGVGRLFLFVLPTPYTLHPTPHTPHPTPYTPHPTPHTPHPTPHFPTSHCAGGLFSRE
ncbi:hypothetical protein, partial [Microcystis sp. M53602_WE12]|uniref:hypothetical protein n=1 Tax=Microcystis sp. M53602_WE12 TaxID=3030674 RepID=UPI00258F41CB